MKVIVEVEVMFKVNVIVIVLGTKIRFPEIWVKIRPAGASQ